MKTTTVGVKDAAKKTGVTYRQLDYWIAQGLIPSSGSNGSGHVRTVEQSDLKRIALLGRVSRALRSTAPNVAVPLALLDRVATNSAVGKIDLGEGVTLTWKRS